MTEELTEAKRVLRKQALSNRRGLSKEQREEYSGRIQKQLLEIPEFHKAKRVFAFASMPDEVHTEAILACMLAQGKEVSIPLVTGERQMEAVTFSSMEDLVPEKYGILTVKPECRKIVEPSELDLILVPGVAFSKDGIRLGMGGGYYDAFLQRAGSAYRLAVVYNCQMFEQVPAAPWDAQADAILTEQGFTICTK